MKASELINELKEIISYSGDKEVVDYDYNRIYNVDDVGDSIRLG